MDDTVKKFHFAVFLKNGKHGNLLYFCLIRNVVGYDVDYLASWKWPAG